MKNPFQQRTFSVLVLGVRWSEIGTYYISAQGPGGGSRNNPTTARVPRGRTQSWGSRGTPSRSVSHPRGFSEGADRHYEDGPGRRSRGKRGRSFDGGRGRSRGREGEKRSVVWPHTF